MARTWLLALALVLIPTLSSFCEDIPLENCDRLPLVEVRISGNKFIFLVDTAATSALNLQAFAHGDPTRAAVSSWTGTTEARAQNVVIHDLAIGSHHLKNIRLIAVDLSAIGRACGRRIDGILGLDLMIQLGLTVDLKNHTARFPADSEDVQARVAELSAALLACEAAFNRADEAVFSACLDPNVVLFAAGGDFYGRDAAMQYYREHYFRHNPPAHLDLTPRAHHPIGGAIWMEYDLRLSLGERILQVRGTALCTKSDGRWRIVHMNHSSPGTAVWAEEQR
ncbi:MAG TPA: nuclear transport factor 2 family protein [Candidatus Angelobacter sp.]|nr:nuclear transport factor 2 family protein [Candidatus Angelobacter sp.]